MQKSGRRNSVLPAFQQIILTRKFFFLSVSLTCIIHIHSLYTRKYVVSKRFSCICYPSRGQQVLCKRCFWEIHCGYQFIVTSLQKSFLKRIDKFIASTLVQKHCPLFLVSQDTENHVWEKTALNKDLQLLFRHS